jgi:hypothetical protein
MTMRHFCPNCGKRNFSLRSIIKANSNHGTDCPDCGAIVRVTLFGRIAPGIPLVLCIAGTIVVRPPLGSELATLAIATVIGFGMYFMFPLEVVRKDSRKAEGQLPD